MKFVTLGNKSIRADLIEVIQVHMGTVTVYCHGGAKYVHFFNSCEEAQQVRDTMLAELAKN